MNKIDWCKRKKEGFKLIEPNDNLANAYIKKAEDSLTSMMINIIKEWKIATGYYTMYFSLYAILMKIGIKCEIHSCTIEFARQFLNDYLDEDDIEMFVCASKARNDSQYYIDRAVPNEDFKKVIKNAPLVLIKCKSILEKIDENKIKEIRKDLSKGCV